MSGARAWALSPLDGRYGERLAPLGAYFSELALVRARVRVEVAHARALDALGLFAPLSPDEDRRLCALTEGFGEEAFAAVKAIEAETRHDVKAVELYLRDGAALREPNRLHFALTSEDVNNLAYSTLFSAYIREQQLPALAAVLRALITWARDTAGAPFPSRTHGQPATPSTFGKELAVYVERLRRCHRALSGLRLAGKLNGATGTHGAAAAAAPHVDWRAYEKRLVEGLGLELNPISTQIEDHDSWARWLHESRLLSSVLVDLCRDMWMYISNGWVVQRARPGEVGSSTMPHKVNPIRFENAEGNLELSSALMAFLAEKLTRSRMQRDLSDSTVSRNVGVALAHLSLAMDEVRAGLAGVSLDVGACTRALDATPELLAEPIMTALRLEGHPDPYAALKSLTRGRAVTAEEIAVFVGSAPMREETRQRLAALQPAAYVGLAEQICADVLDAAERTLGDR